MLLMRSRSGSANEVSRAIGVHSARYDHASKDETEIAV